jgi:hypothetical protein
MQTSMPPAGFEPTISAGDKELIRNLKWAENLFVMLILTNLRFI